MSCRVSEKNNETSRPVGAGDFVKSEVPAPKPAAGAGSSDTRVSANEVGGDALLACLLVVASVHGQALAADAVLAGLPLEEGVLTPALFERAAHRAGLVSRIARQPLDRIEPALLPAVLLLEDQRACVLLDCDAAAATCRVVFPELGEAPVLLHSVPAVLLVLRLIRRRRQAGAATDADN